MDVRRAGAVAAIAVVLGAAGCAGTSSNKSAARGAARIEKPGTVTGDGNAPAGAGSGASAGVQGGQQQSGTTAVPAKGTPVVRPLARPAIDPRSIVYTGALSILASDVRTTADKATQAVVDAGGVLFDARYSSGQPSPGPSPIPLPSDGTVPSGADQGTDTQPSTTTGPTADLTYKVPPAHFTPVVLALSKLGRTVSQTQNADDVTDQVVDLTSRVDTAQRSVGRVRALLDRATSIGDVVELEGELSKREADLESLEGQLRVLNAQTALATVTVHIEQPPTHAAQPPVAKKHHATGFVAGLRAGWHGFVRSLNAVLTVLGAVLPFALLLAALVAVALRVRRMWRGPRSTPPTVGDASA